jgi:hypothetical protein
VSYNRKNKGKKVFDCFYCSAKIFFDDNIRSEKTNKRLPLNIEDSTRHECASFYAVNNRAAGRKRCTHCYYLNSNNNYWTKVLMPQPLIMVYNHDMVMRFADI